MSNYNNGIIQSSTVCTGTYKSTLMYGIGTFTGLSTTILKHLSIGTEFTFQIQHLTRKLDWHGVTQNYGTYPSINVDDESLKFRNYFTSKIVPTIVIAYTFNSKRDNKPLVMK